MRLNRQPDVGLDLTAISAVEKENMKQLRIIMLSLSFMFFCAFPGASQENADLIALFKSTEASTRTNAARQAGIRLMKEAVPGLMLL